MVVMMLRDPKPFPKYERQINNPCDKNSFSLQVLHCLLKRH